MRLCYRPVQMNTWEIQVTAACQQDQATHAITLDCVLREIQDGDTVVIIKDIPGLAPYSLIGSTGVVKDEWHDLTEATIVFEDGTEQKMPGYCLLKIEK